MVKVTAGCCGTRWFGVVWSQESLVATAVGSTRSEALRNVAQCIPPAVAARPVDDPSSYAAGVIAMLGELESGNEEHKRYTLSNEYLSGPMYRILTVAAAIPIGYVTTYGNIANVAGSEARGVGRVMAMNPLYPIVPCHRVVGADMSLIGYGGKQDSQALKAKLSRIAAEVRGAQSDKEVATKDGPLTVYPAERVIEAAREKDRRRIEAQMRESAGVAADRMQYRLF